MKNKLIYVFILIFSISMISSAKKIQGTCSRASACTNLQTEKCKETKKTEAAKETDFDFPSLGLFLFNI